jgi:cytochrome c biogenesis protein CcmG/thiol:disulfide interchange protein DsbE
MKRQQRGRALRSVAVAVALSAALAACRTAAPRAGGGTTPGSPAPTGSGWQEVPLSDLDSHPVTLAKVLAGRPALVNLWAPWCERCKTELPDLDRLAPRLEGCAVVVGVAVGEDAPHTAAFVHERGLGYPQVVDEGFHLADTLRQSRVPTTLVIDGAGTIVHVGFALDAAAVGALETTVGRAETGGHCKSSRPAG